MVIGNGIAVWGTWVCPGYLLIKPVQSLPSHVAPSRRPCLGPHHLSLYPQMLSLPLSTVSFSRAGTMSLRSLSNYSWSHQNIKRTNSWEMETIFFFLFIAVIYWYSGNAVKFNYIQTVNCSFSVVESCLTLWNPMDWSKPGFPVLLYLPEFAQTHVIWVSGAIQPSHPLLSLSLGFNLSQHQGLFQWVSQLLTSGGQSIRASASVLPVGCFERTAWNMYII